MLVLLVSLLVTQIYIGTAQLSIQETLLEITTCDMVASVNITCGGGEMIVYESLRYFFDFQCNSICCTYDASHSVVSASALDTANIRRQCSGISLCSINLPTTHTFDIAGSQTTSYILLGYYCIPETRIMPVCTTGTISSDGLPMYLRSPNYPAPTTGEASCSCSVEVYSCTSDVNVFTVDVDMYKDPDTCTQRLEFTDGSATTLKEIQCDDFYGSSISTDTLTSNYLIVNFQNNNTQYLEGLFFVGFEGSETGVETKIACNTEQESWCVDCGSVPSVTSGAVTLDDTNNSAYGATASVTCDPGYESSTATITCVEKGSWETPTCSAKDCGSVPSVSSGTATLDDTNNSTYGATASVTCDPGYETTTATITCAETGTWGTPTCDDNDGPGGGFPAWAIALIVIGVLIAVSAAVAIPAYRVYRRNYRISATSEEGRQPVKGALPAPSVQVPPDDVTLNGRQPVNEASHASVVQTQTTDVALNGRQPVNEASRASGVQTQTNDVALNGRQPVNEASRASSVQTPTNDVALNGRQPVNEALDAPIVQSTSTSIISNYPTKRSDLNILESQNQMTSVHDRPPVAPLYDNHTGLKTPS